MKAACTLAAAVWCAGASAQADPAAVLLRGRERIHEAVGSLSKYTCTQTVDRSYFRQQGRRGAGCDEIVANKNRGRFRLDLTATDRLRLDVAVADSGVEIYSWPNAGRIGARKVEDLAAGGPIGTGSFGGFLRDVFENPGAEVAYDKAEPLEGQTLLRYRFRVPLKASHYGVQGGAVYSRTAYGGAFWLDPASGDLRRLMVRTGELAPNTGVCEATTQVDLTYSRIGAGDYLVPRGSLLHTVGRYGSETESAATYSACREYHGDSLVHFDAGEAAQAMSRLRGRANRCRRGCPLCWRWKMRSIPARPRRAIRLRPGSWRTSWRCRQPGCWLPPARPSAAASPTWSTMSKAGRISWLL